MIVKIGQLYGGKSILTVHHSHLYGRLFDRCLTGKAKMQLVFMESTCNVPILIEFCVILGAVFA